MLIPLQMRVESALAFSALMKECSGEELLPRTLALIYDPDKTAANVSYEVFGNTGITELYNTLRSVSLDIPGSAGVGDRSATGLVNLLATGNNEERRMGINLSAINPPPDCLIQFRLRFGESAAFFDIPQFPLNIFLDELGNPELAGFDFGPVTLEMFNRGNCSDPAGAGSEVFLTMISQVAAGDSFQFRPVQLTVGSRQPFQD